MEKWRIKPVSFFFALASFALFAVHSVEASEPVEGKSFEVYGFAMLDYIQDFNRVDPDWKDTLRSSKIPTEDGQFGQDGEASLSAKQSRFGVNATLPVDAHTLKTKLEFDFFGVGPDEGQTTIRLRHAYGEWGNWLAGQTNSLFMDIDVFPNVIDYWGPTGMVFFRTPQIRWSPIQGDQNFSIAIEVPGPAIDTGQIREVDPNFGGSIQPRSKLPDLTAMYRMNGDWGHVQASGILRSLGFETLGNPGNNPHDDEIGWGIDLGSKFLISPRNKLILSAVYGQGISNYMNDGGTDLAPEGPAIGSLSAKAVPLLGLTAYLEHSWNEKWTSALGYSQTSVENTNFQADDAYKRAEYASINALCKPGKNMMAGIELLWGSRTDKDGGYGSDLRTQVSMRYDFSSKDF